MIELSRPSLRLDDFLRSLQVFRSEKYVQGNWVQKVESQLSESLSARHSILTSSCTTALEASLYALGVKFGDLVLVSGYSWQASANCIEVIGATPIFVDIDPQSFNVTPNTVRCVLDRLIAEGSLSRVAAMVIVHTFGSMCEVASILRILDEHGIPLLEDAACALGAESRDGFAGTLGSIGCFSFHPRKSVTCGEGGALITNNSSLYRLARLYCNHGRAIEDDGEFESRGTNFRLTEFQAAMLWGQMCRINEINQRRKEIAHQYFELLENVQNVELPVDGKSSSVWQAFAIKVPVQAAKLKLQLSAEGVEVGLGTLCIPFTKYYSHKYDITPKDFPGLCAVSDRTITLPIHNKLRVSQIKKVVSSLIKVLK